MITSRAYFLNLTEKKALLTAAPVNIGTKDSSICHRKSWIQQYMLSCIIFNVSTRN